jgi:hypothetical protein
MKSLFSLVFIAIAVLSGIPQQSEALPCDKQVFHALCNPSLKIVENCYDCYRLDKDKERCFPSFKKFDITDFLSTKKWNCTVHEWENKFHPESEIDFE